MPERASVTKRTDEEIMSLKSSENRKRRHRNDYDTMEEQLFYLIIVYGNTQRVSSFKNKPTKKKGKKRA